MNIRNKLQSYETLINRGINRINEAVFLKGDREAVTQWMQQYPYPFYGMRDKIKSGGQFLYHITAEEVLSHIHDYQKFSVAQSLYDADHENLIMQGAISIDKDMNVLASVTDEMGQSNRVTESNPKYKLVFNLCEDRMPLRPYHLDKVIEFYMLHDFFPCVMEFGFYNIPVGTNPDNILVWEIRNY